MRGLARLTLSVINSKPTAMSQFLPVITSRATLEAASQAASSKVQQGLINILTCNVVLMLLDTREAMI